MLDGREAKENLRARFPTDRRPYTDGYDYEDDSDLEDGDEEDTLDDEPAAPLQAAAATDKPRNSSDTPSIENSGAKSEETLDMVSVSDLDSLFFEPSDTKEGAETPSSAHVGKVVVIEDVAFIT